MLVYLDETGGATGVYRFCSAGSEEASRCRAGKRLKSGIKFLIFWTVIKVVNICNNGGDTMNSCDLDYILNQ